MDRRFSFSSENSEDERNTLFAKSAVDSENATLIGKDPDNFLAPSAHTWTKGDVIDGLYRVENIVKGGMGIIYFVDHLKWGIKLVVKSPLAKFLEDEHKLRFIKEAETWVDLGKHPNIATAFYVKELNNIPRIFIEYADGGSLGEWLKEKRLKEWQKILDVAIQFCEGMIHAHSKGLVHRDIKPDNVLMTKDGIVKITDFGLAKTKNKRDLFPAEDGLTRPSSIAPEEWQTMTRGGILGTPPYMPPEQWTDSERTDKRSDIYSFGVMLYEMICGRCPFLKEPDNLQPAVIAYQLMHRFTPPPDPQELRSDIPKKLKEMLLKCLEKIPESRYTCFEEIQDELINIYSEVTTKEYERLLPGEAELKTDDLNNRALSYLDLGKKHEARTLLEDAIKLDPNSLSASINLIILLMEERWDTYENILLRFKSIREGNPNNSTAYYYEAIFELEWGNPKNSLSLISKALNLDNTSGMLWNFRGVVLSLLKRYEEASESFKKAFQSDRVKLDYKRNYAKTLYYMGNQRECAEELKRLLTLYPGDMDIKSDLSFALTGKMEENREVKESNFPRVGEIKILGCQSGRINGVSFFPDGDHAVSSHSDARINLWDLRTGINIKTLSLAGNTGFEYFDIDVSPCGRHIIAAYSNKVEMWDVEIGQCIKTFNGHKNIVRSVRFSPDGNLIASSSVDLTVKIWDKNTGECIKSIDNMVIVFSVRFSPDGKYIATGGQMKDIRIWDIKTGECHKKFFGHTGPVLSVCFSPEGKHILSGSEDMTLRLWDMENEKCVKVFSGHMSQIESVHFSSTGNYAVSGSAEGTMKIWDIEKGVCVRTIKEHTSAVTAAEYSPDGRYLLTASKDRTIRYIHLPLMLNQPVYRKEYLIVKPRTVEESLKDEEIFKRLILEGEKNLTQGKHEEAMRVFRRALEISGYARDKGALSLLHRAGKYAVREGIRKIWISENSQPEGKINKFDLPGDGKFMFYCGEDSTVRTLEFESGKKSESFSEHRGRVSGVRVSDDGRYLLSAGDDNTIKLRDMNRNECIRTISLAVKTGDIALFPGSRYIASCGGVATDSTIKIWSVETGECLRTFEGHKLSVNTINILKDGRYFISGGDDKSIKLWYIENNKYLKNYVGHSFRINDTSISPDERHIASASADKTIKIWDIDKEECVITLYGHQGEVTGVDFSPDGRFIVSGSADKTLRVWNGRNGECLSVLEGHSAQVTDVRFSPDGRYILSASMDETMKVWEIDWEWKFPENETIVPPLLKDRPPAFDPSELFIESKEPVTVEYRKQPERSGIPTILTNIFIILALITGIFLLNNLLKPDKQKMEEHIEGLYHRFPAPVNWKDEAKWFIKYNSLTARFKITQETVDALTNKVNVDSLKPLIDKKGLSKTDLTGKLSSNYTGGEIEIILDQAFWPDNQVVDPALIEITKKINKDKRSEVHFICLKLLEGIYSKDRNNCPWEEYYTPREALLKLLKSEIPAIRGEAAKVLNLINNSDSFGTSSALERLKEALNAEDSYWAGKIDDIESSRFTDKYYNKDKGIYENKYCYKCVYCHTWNRGEKCIYSTEKPYEFVKSLIKETMKKISG